MSATRRRLPAPERRAALLECACGVFSSGSYHGATTAEIAREAGVTEPVLYRHFDSKRELYLACLDEVWVGLRNLWEDAIAAEPDPAEWVTAMGRAFLQSPHERVLLTNLWIPSLAEATDDHDIRSHLRKQILDVHGFVADVIRRSQTAGGVARERDADAEAWIFISLGLLALAEHRLGGLGKDVFPQIVASRRRWLLGR